MKCDTHLTNYSYRGLTWTGNTTRPMSSKLPTLLKALRCQSEALLPVAFCNATALTCCVKGQSLWCFDAVYSSLTYYFGASQFIGKKTEGKKQIEFALVPFQNICGLCSFSLITSSVWYQTSHLDPEVLQGARAPHLPAGPAITCIAGKDMFLQVSCTGCNTTPNHINK